MHQVYWVPLTASAASLVIGWWLVHGRLSKFALDLPNERSLHEAPIPRTGGIAIQAGTFAAWIIAPDSVPPPLWLAWGAVVLISFWDDLKDLPAWLRLAVHLFAALAVSSYYTLDTVGIMGVILTTIAIAWMANLYNFMDGADGLAGGMTVFGFGFYGLAAWLAGDAPFAVLQFSVAGSAAAFLVFNLHPARVFMGDVGSVPLGFLAGTLGLAGWVRGDWEAWFPFVVFSPFVVDASVTLARRLLMREQVWIAHRDHYYQRLVRLGWGHRKTAWAEYALMASCGAVGLVTSGRTLTVQVAGITAIGLLYTVLIAAIAYAWRRQGNLSAR